MDNNEIRDMLAFIDKNLNTASDCLFVSQLSFEKINDNIFERTVKSIKEKIQDINKARSLLIDYINNMDFPNNTIHEDGQGRCLRGWCEDPGTECIKNACQFYKPARP